MTQYAHAPHGWQHISEQFDTFSIRRGSHQRHARNVSPGPRQAGDYSGFDGGSCQYHDGDITCCLLRCQRAGDVQCHDHIDLEEDQLGCKLGESIQPTFRGAKLECNVSSLHIAKFTQSFPKPGPERLRVGDS